MDDDVDMKSLLPANLSNTLDEDVGDNDPTVADVIDERPEHVKQLEKYRSSGQWKVMGQSAGKQHKLNVCIKLPVLVGIDKLPKLPLSAKLYSLLSDFSRCFIRCRVVYIMHSLHSLNLLRTFQMQK